MSDTPADKLRAARFAAGYASAAEAARARGWKEATYRHHENGTRGYGKDHAKAYGRAFNVSASWLLGLSGEATPDIVEKTIGEWESREELEWGIDRDFSEQLDAWTGQRLVRHFRPVDFIGKPSAIPLHVDRHGEPGFRAIDTSLVDRVANVEDTLVFSIYAPDASMAPTIRDGALVLIDAGEREANRQDAVWLVIYAGQVMLRRIRHLPDDRFELHADFGSMPPLVASRYDVDVRGRVVWVGQEI